MNNLESKKTFEEIFLKSGFALKMLETELDILLKNYVYESHHNPIEHTKSRLKSEQSIINKLNEKGLESTTTNLLNHIHDLIGFRIVCSFLSDVYLIVDLIKKSEKFKIKYEKDYIKNPKETGYRSYHIIVEMPITLDNKTQYVDAEIQVRTIAMDFWASLDHKIQYKLGDIPTEIEKDMLNCSYNIRDLDDKMNNLNKIVHKYQDDK